jgi:hypothetical protein
MTDSLRDRIMAVLPPPTWPVLVLIVGCFVIWWRNGW